MNPAWTRRKLTELHPRWLGAGGPGIYNQDGSQVPERTGIGFLCDCPCGCGAMLSIDFANPLDGGPPYGTPPHWKRTGDTWDTMVLTPSVLRTDTCRWHGFLGGPDGKSPGWMVPV